MIQEEHKEVDPQTTPLTESQILPFIYTGFQKELSEPDNTSKEKVIEEAKLKEEF